MTKAKTNVNKEENKGDAKTMKKEGTNKGTEKAVENFSINLKELNSMTVTDRKTYILKNFTKKNVLTIKNDMILNLLEDVLVSYIESEKDDKIKLKLKDIESYIVEAQENIENAENEASITKDDKKEELKSVASPKDNNKKVLNPNNKKKDEKKDPNKSPETNKKDNKTKETNKDKKTNTGAKKDDKKDDKKKEENKPKYKEMTTEELSKLTNLDVCNNTHVIYFIEADEVAKIVYIDTDDIIVKWTKGEFTSFDRIDFNKNIALVASGKKQIEYNIKVYKKPVEENKTK